MQQEILSGIEDELKEEIPLELFSKLEKAIENKVESGEVLILSDMEIQLIKAYREHLETIPIGGSAIFEWDAQYLDKIIVPAKSISIIKHPNSIE